MKDDSRIEMCSTGSFSGHEIKLEDDATGLVPTGAGVNIEQVEVKDDGYFTINASPVTITDEIKNKNQGTIAGLGGFDWSGSTFENTGTGGIFNCFQAVYDDCNFPPIVALPVELIDFSFNIVNNDVILNWATASEINNSHFEVWVASDELEFHKIKTVKGKGNSNELNYYASGFTPVLSGVLYVKLRQVDYSGEYTDSDIISLIYSKSLETIPIEVYPNPATNKIAFKNLGLDSEYSVEVYSSHGVQMKSGKVSVEHNYIDIQGLEAGTYTVRVHNSNSMVNTLKFVKLK